MTALRTALGSGHRSRQVLILVLGIVLALSGLVAVASTALAATDPCGTGGNPIACENSKPGTDPGDWDIWERNAGDDSIQGFATDISVNAGSPISFKIDTDVSNYTITIYRMGYYGGDGARQIATVTPSATLPQHQPNCLWDASTELTDCGNWGVSATWNVPSSAVSGVYIAKLEIPSTGARSHITFVVRNDSSHSDVVFQTADTSWQAYNKYGGSSFYTGGANGRAYKVSYNRPVVTRTGGTSHDFFFANEYPLVRFLERNGYDVSYLAGVDSDRYGSLLQNHKVFLSVGHDEYWSGAQRANVEAARDAGVNLQFLSGNEVYWRTRYEPSISTDHTSYRTLVSYKESWSYGKIDPSPEWTGTWRDPRYAAQSAGAGKPENALTGTIFMSNLTDLPVTVTKSQGKTRLWRNTGLSGMAGTSTALAPHTVGYESDEDQDNGSRAPGLIDLSTTTGPVSGQYMQDYANTTGDGTTTHSITLYKAASGALVFGAGSVQWTWGLDEVHDSPYGPEPADIRMQQAQVNLLADMGAQPTTLMAGLVAATKSTDTAGPTVTITSPAQGAALVNGSQVTISGTATDTGGGVVAGVEYSTDGGAGWHPAQGTTSWTISYVQHDVGSTPIRVRAVDDSANAGQAVTRSFNVSCPCSLYGDSTIPTTWTSATGPSLPAADDPDSAELGLRFSPLSDGFVTGVRFYKGTGNTGTHVGTLWSTSGERLAGVTFAGESAGGWQSAIFSTPVAVAAGATYVVSYTAPNGHYAYQPYAYSAAGLYAPPLEVQGGYGAPAAGVYGVAGTFPALTSKNSSYYVDVLFSTTDASPLIATNQWPLAGSSSVPLDTTISARYSKPLQTGSQGIVVEDQLGATVAGATAYNATTRTITFTPSAPLNGFVAYTVTLSGLDTQGNALTNGNTWSFTTVKPPAAPGVCPCTLFDDGEVPVMPEATDGTPLTLGVKFSSSQDGLITGVKFYKSASNTGTHTGTLWTTSGQQLATGTFSGESTTGWQTLTFSQPVAITAGTQYVASYYSPTGSYSLTPDGFMSENLSRAPLQVTAGSGMFVYGNGYPGSSTASNYFVDPVFEPGTTTPSDPPPDPGIPAGSQSLFGTSTPAVPAADDDPAPVELGTRFRPAKDGTISAIRFYKGAGNGSTHTGSIWSATGTRLATVTFTNETASGWQTATLATPLAVDAGTTYVVSYLAPQGHYAYTSHLFDEAVTSGDLSAPAGANGVYQYDGGFPAYSWNSTSYFVDVVYQPSTPTIAVTGTSPAADASGVATDTQPSIGFSKPLATGWAMALTQGGTPVAGAASLSGDGKTLTFTPSAALPALAQLTVTVSGAVSTGGAVLPTTSWSFQTAAPPPVTTSLLGEETPATLSNDDPDVVELGLKLTPSVDGRITAIRFYKGDGNTGTHTGSVWSSSGQLLGTVTFTGETASGWQQATLATPVPVTAGQTYVVSYLAPAGHYSSTSNYFVDPVATGPLTAPGGANGLYQYGGGFPTGYFRSTNYYVDAVFTNAP